jgi:steroid delta-isomerase-like uncharacterized protein
MSASSNIQLAERVYEKFCNSEFDRVLDLAADDIQIVFSPTGQTFQGHDGFMQFMQGFKSAFPDIALTVTNQVATDDKIVTEFTVKGTHTGPLMIPAGQIPATGRTAEWPVCEVWTVRQGKLTSIHNYQDLGTMLRQLGLVS